MFCNKCGTKNDDGAKFCLKCGNNLQFDLQPAPAPAEQPAPAPVEQPVPAPVEQPVSAPVEQPAPAPVEQPAAASTEQSAAAPIPQAPAAAPGQIPLAAAPAPGGSNKKTVIIIVAIAVAAVICIVASFFILRGLFGGSQSGPTSNPIGDFFNPGVQIEVGDYVHFGNYTWQVLDKKDGNVLLFSERVIEERMYYAPNHRVGWDTSDMRTYLNGEFLNKFSAEEQSKIVTSHIPASDNPWDFSESVDGGNEQTVGGEDTDDKIFLLSIEEVAQYFMDDTGRAILAQKELGRTEVYFSDEYNDERVAYSRIHGLSTADEGSANWILRTPGCYSNTVIFVAKSGKIGIRGVNTNEDHQGVRPAMWVKDDGTLELSEVKCTDPECYACTHNVYVGTPDPDSYCPLCGYSGECRNKEIHNRLYHDWMYGLSTMRSGGSSQSAEIASAQSLFDEVEEKQNKLSSLWSEFYDLMKNATSSTTTDGSKSRLQRIIGEEMYARLLSLQQQEAMTFYVPNYMSESQAKEAIADLDTKIARLEKNIPVLKQAIEDADNSAISNEAEGLFALGDILIFGEYPDTQSGSLDSYLEREFF